MWENKGIPKKVELASDTASITASFPFVMIKLEKI